MAKFNGFGGGMGNMQGLLKQAQEMQKQMAKAQEELAELEVEGSAGNGLVVVTMTCKKQVTAVTIKPEAVDVEDLEMLEDLLVVAFNDATDQAEEVSKEKLGPLGANMGGLL